MAAVTKSRVMDILSQAGDDFSNILCAHFWYKSALHSFSGLHIFWQKNIGKNSAHKMLMKLTPGCRYSLAEI